MNIDQCRNDNKGLKTRSLFQSAKLSTLLTLLAYISTIENFVMLTEIVLSSLLYCCAQTGDALWPNKVVHVCHLLNHVYTTLVQIVCKTSSKAKVAKTIIHYYRIILPYLGVLGQKVCSQALLDAPLLLVIGSCGSHTEGQVTAVVAPICCVACIDLFASCDLVTMARSVTRAVAGWIIMMACILHQSG